MMSCFVVVANCIENEVSGFSSELLVLILKVLSSADVGKILCERVAAEGYE
jgi:hypothetical protein